MTTVAEGHKDLLKKRKKLQKKIDRFQQRLGKRQEQAIVITGKLAKASKKMEALEERIENYEEDPQTIVTGTTKKPAARKAS